MPGEAVSVLILTSLLDLPTDRICHHLSSRGVRFLRINRDQVEDLRIAIDPLHASMTCRIGGNTWHVDPELRSVWWRNPTFRRNTPGRALSCNEQFVSSQWAATLRGLMLFDGAVWINDPASTYRAEAKPFQLRLAAKLGFDIPSTVITNDRESGVPALVGNPIALKSVDTLLLQDEWNLYFGYTNLIAWEACADEHFHLAPATCQAVLRDKLDLRVTIVGDRLWCDAVTLGGSGVEGDWRVRLKSELRFDDHELPADVASRCLALVRDMGLRFGAIDLALSQGRYWFVEINPTGEWGWLDRAGRGISEAIAEELCRPCR